MLRIAPFFVAALSLAPFVLVTSMADPAVALVDRSVDDLVDEKFNHLEARAKCLKNSQCGSVFGGSVKCRNGSCRITCNANRILRNGKCVANLQPAPALQGSGKTCNRGSLCTTPVADASGLCVNGKCVITCNVGFTSARGQCVEPPLPSAGRCSKDSTCATGLQNAFGLCISGLCETHCDSGYTIYNGFCLASKDPPPVHAGKCLVDLDCSTHVPFGRPICLNGICSFVCESTFIQVGKTCHPTTERCSFDRQCPAGGPHSVGVCDGSTGRCNIQCVAGFTPSNGACVPSPSRCGKDTCNKALSGGYYTCENGLCSPQCYTSQGYQLYCGVAGCACIRTGNDINNCGIKGNVCQPGYNGLGKITCVNGLCGLDCRGLVSGMLPNGNKFCKAPLARR